MPKIKEIDFANLQKKFAIEDIREDQIMFYDTETDHQHGAYAYLNSIGVKYGFKGKAEIVRTPKQKDRFRDALADPDMIKVGFNCKNFDNKVLLRHGYPVNNINNHDAYLMAKACSALLPSYALKFILWWFLGKMHFSEGKIDRFRTQTGEKDWAMIPPHILIPYLQEDLDAHSDAFCLFWETVMEEPHWSAYMLDLAVCPAIMEMELVGGLDIDLQICKKKIQELEDEKAELNEKADLFTDGYIKNVNSSRDVGDWLDLQGFAIDLTNDGEFSLKKEDLVDLAPKDPIAKMMFRVREINGVVKYFKAYERAATEGPVLQICKEFVRIPRSYSVSNARTRRPTSSSLYGINFQNPNEEAKEAHIVPPGELWCGMDATQIENIVHIYESEDKVRRKAYEEDKEWSEYVWLCNEILGGTPRTKEELDSIPSPENPNWTVYKQFKTAKLALNFGMGVAKFCLTTGLSREIGLETFRQIHEACPAIHKLQDKVKALLRKNGRVEDVFGHIYAGPERKAYKVVAYLIQGCGTGSLPKAQIYANWRTLQRNKTGVMIGTTHDDNCCRLKLDMDLLPTLRELMYNMTTRFSYKFDNIPLRAKMYLSKTTERKKIGVDINDTRGILQICNGNPCPACEAWGKINKKKCPSCNGYGYN